MFYLMTQETHAVPAHASETSFSILHKEYLICIVYNAQLILSVVLFCWIGLTKRFVWLFLQDDIEKPKHTFWPAQYFITLHSLLFSQKNCLPLIKLIL